MDVSSIVVALIGYAGIVTPIILNQRYKNKKEIEMLKEALEENKDTSLERYTELSDKITAMNEHSLEKDAKDARIRILRFSDECRNKIEHSEEHFINVLDDIKTYTDYCETHPQFENGRTVSAEELIQEIYNKCLRENSFL